MVSSFPSLTPYLGKGKRNWWANTAWKPGPAEISSKQPSFSRRRISVEIRPICLPNDSPQAAARRSKPWDWRLGCRSARWVPSPLRQFLTVLSRCNEGMPEPRLPQFSPFWTLPQGDRKRDHITLSQVHNPAFFLVAHPVGFQPAQIRLKPWLSSISCCIGAEPSLDNSRCLLTVSSQSIPDLPLGCCHVALTAWKPNGAFKHSITPRQKLPCTVW